MAQLCFCQRPGINITSFHPNTLSHWMQKCLLNSAVHNEEALTVFTATYECIFYCFEECFKILTQERRSAWMFYVPRSSKSDQICCCQISSALRCVFEYQCLIFWMVRLATVIFLYAQSYLLKCAKINYTLYLTNIYISIKTPLKMMRKNLHSLTHTHTH